MKDQFDNNSYSPIRVKEKRQSMSLRFWLIIFLILSSIGLCVYTGLPDVLKNWVQGFVIRTPTAQIVSGQTIVQSVKSLGQLVTVRARVAKAGIEITTQYGLVCRVGANHVVQGSVEGGVDLSGLTEENLFLETETDTYVIRLPSARLIGCYIDPVATQQYSTWGATFACPMDFDEMRRLASYVAINEFRDDALEGGLLNEAQLQAENVLSNFIRALTGKAVRIEFLPAESLPQSCSPEPPGFWTYDEAQHLWSKP